MMRPREKALSCGLSSLTDEELLALVLETGSKKTPVETLSEEVVKKYHGLSSVLFEMEGIVHENGIGLVKRLRLMTSLEVIRRFSLMTISEISSPRECFLLTRTFFFKRKKEALLIFLLTDRDRVKQIIRLDSGYYDKVRFPFEVVNQLSVSSGDGLLFVHNHPSGDASFSAADLSCYHTLCHILMEKGIRLVSFMVVGNDGYAFMPGFSEENEEFSGN